MINQIVKFSVLPEHCEAFTYALIKDKEGTAQEAGCVEMKLFVDNKNPNLIFAYERFKDQAALDHHIEQPYTRHVLTLAETALDTPVEVMRLGETSPAPDHFSRQANPGDDIFIIFFIFKFKPEYRERLIERFEEHVTQTRKEEGNILFDLFTVEGADDTLAVYEHWRNESAVWDIHFKQPYSKITGTLMHEAVVGDMEQYMNFVTEIG